MGLGEEKCGGKVAFSRRKKGLIRPHSLDHFISMERGFEKPGKHFLDQKAWVNSCYAKSCWNATVSCTELTQS